jgi:starch phosphorylase
MAVARLMYRGCDVWLNNPRRPLEACGTSGMKAALNGCLNCSILDGWWDECYDGTNGWAITSADDDPDLARRDAREATSLFGLLEREIVPLFYDRADDDVAHGWVDRIKNNWRSLGPFVTASRMVRDYTSELYEPAAASAVRLLADDAAQARELAVWKQRIIAAWPGVKVVQVDVDERDGREGETRQVRAGVELGGLSAKDVTVQAWHGPVDWTGAFVNHPARVELQPSDDGFVGDVVIGEAGAYGITVRCLPHHPAQVSPVELGLVAWAS